MQPLDFLFPLLYFGVGFGIGWFGHEKLAKMDKISESRIIAFVVTIIWAVSVLAQIVVPGYETSPLIHGIMGALVGYFYVNKEGKKK